MNAAILALVTVDEYGRTKEGLEVRVEVQTSSTKEEVQQVIPLQFGKEAVEEEYDGS